MQKRTALLGLLAVTFLATAQSQSTGDKSRKPHKLVIQMSDNDPAKWNLLLNNAKNVQEELGAANVDIEVVAYGPGINMLKIESAANSRIAEAIKAGITVTACENTLRNLKLSRADMLSDITYVPAGVVQLMRRQSEGWAYLRP